jgi:hypothetical protein
MHIFTQMDQHVHNVVTDETRPTIEKSKQSDIYGLHPVNEYFCITRSDPMKGRGLIATRDILPHTVLHVAPTIILHANEYQSHLKYTLLEDYLFKAPSNGQYLLALGYGSLFNHSQSPNVDYRIERLPTESELSNQADTPPLNQSGDHPVEYIITYKSGHQHIKCGDELCIFYGTNISFDDQSIPTSNSSLLHSDSIVWDNDDFLYSIELADM